MDMKTTYCRCLPPTLVSCMSVPLNGVTFPMCTVSQSINCCPYNATETPAELTLSVINVMESESFMEVEPNWRLDSHQNACDDIEAQSKEYLIRLSRQEGEPLGISLDVSDNISAIVTAVQNGVVDAWNEGADENSRIDTGDRIVDVNGFSGDAEKILQRLRKDTELQIVLQRPTEFNVSIEKVGNSIGLEFAHAVNGQSLLVNYVRSSGPVANWNSVHRDLAVKKNDRIVEVNGIRGDSRELLDLIKEPKNLELILARYRT